MSTESPKAPLPMSDDELKEIQDQHVITAKHIILKEPLAPIAFLFMSSGDALNLRMGDMAGPMQAAFSEEGHDPKSGYSTALMSLNFTWADRFEILKSHLGKKSPLKALTLELLRSAAVQKVGEEESYKFIVSPLMESFKLDRKAIQVIALVDTCRALKAFAVMNVGEGWLSTQKEVRPSEDPNATETISVILETHTIMRFVKVPIFREAGHLRGEGPILGFGESVVDEIVVGSADEKDVEGRFTRILVAAADDEKGAQPGV